MTVPAPIRLLIQQQALPRYRVPVFRELARRPGIDLKLLYAEVPGNPPNCPPDGFAAAITPLRKRILFGHPVYFHPAQRQAVSRAQADVAILSWDLHYAGLVPALLRARRQGVATILWGHGYSKREAGWRAVPRRQVARLATALLFYNHTAARGYRDAGFDPERLFVAPNSLDQAPIQAAAAPWRAAPAQLDAFRHEHGLAPGPVILFVSRLDPDNRLDLLLHAAAQLRPQYPTLQLIIIGRGDDEQPLQSLAATLDLAAHVRFLGALYDEPALAPWFCAADVFCYPANIGLSLLHAFGYGLPVVTSDRLTAQNPEIEALRDGANGLLYADGDAAALAATLRRLLSDPALRSRLAAAACRTVEEQFSLSKMVDGMEAAVRFAAGTRA